MDSSPWPLRCRQRVSGSLTTAAICRPCILSRICRSSFECFVFADGSSISLCRASACSRLALPSLAIYATAASYAGRTPCSNGRFHCFFCDKTDASVDELVCSTLEVLDPCTASPLMSCDEASVAYVLALDLASLSCRTAERQHGALHAVSKRCDDVEAIIAAISLRSQVGADQRSFPAKMSQVGF